MLKYLLPLFLLALHTVSGFAQFKKGTRMAGAGIGNVIYNSGSSDISVAQIGSNKSRITGYNISFNPTIGWFTSDNTAFGAALTINPNGRKTTYEQSGSTYQSDKENQFNLGLGGFVRHYLKPLGKVMPFGQLGLNAGFSNLKTDGYFYGGSGTSAYKTTYTGESNGGLFFNSAFQIGLTKMVSENTGLDFYIGYNYSNSKNTFKRTNLRDDGNDGTIDTRGENETTTRFSNHGFIIGAGFQIFLNKNK